MVVAYPATDSKLSEIRSQDLFHVSSSKYRDLIIKAKRATLHATNCDVELQGMLGWSIAPFRILRDYSVLDYRFDETREWGRYTYFFLGTPGRWAVKKNLGLTNSWGHLGEEMTVYRVPGAELVRQAKIIFYRPDDNVVVIRGGYQGPAFADPAP